MYYVRKTFLKNGYSTTEIQCALHLKIKNKTLGSTLTGTAIIPYMQSLERLADCWTSITLRPYTGQQHAKVSKG